MSYFPAGHVPHTHAEWAPDKTYTNGILSRQQQIDDLNRHTRDAENKSPSVILLYIVLQNRIPYSQFSPAPPLLVCNFISLGPDLVPNFNFLGNLLQELANSGEEILEESNKNQGVVLALYEALKIRDVPAVQQILAPDLEWWFHGPPSHQYLMRLLTGAAPSSFVFTPLKITCFGPTVIAEGCDPTRSTSWVHAWTVSDGIITQLREYLNTSLTVTRLGNHAGKAASEIAPAHCPSVWESSLSGSSVPGLVLAI